MKSMMKAMRGALAVLAIGSTGALAVPTSAQMPNPAAAAESRAHMRSFDWLIGEWEGGGWMMVPGAGRLEFTSAENVEWRLDGRVLLVEGLHHAAVPDASGERPVVHHALGAITWNASRDAYVFHTWLGNQGGSGADNELVATEDGFIWWPATPEGAPRVEFRVRRVDGEWVERGTVTLPDGETMEFFEMRLRRR